MLGKIGTLLGEHILTVMEIGEVLNGTCIGWLQQRVGDLTAWGPQPGVQEKLKIGTSELNS